MPSDTPKPPDGYYSHLDAAVGRYMAYFITASSAAPYREAALAELAAMRERVKRLELELAETRAASRRKLADYNMMRGL